MRDFIKSACYGTSGAAANGFCFLRDFKSERFFGATTYKKKFLLLKIIWISLQIFSVKLNRTQSYFQRKFTLRWNLKISLADFSQLTVLGLLRNSRIQFRSFKGYFFQEQQQQQKNLRNEKRLRLKAWDDDSQKSLKPNDSRLSFLGLSRRRFVIEAATDLSVCEFVLFVSWLSRRRGDPGIFPKQRLRSLCNFSHCLCFCLFVLVVPRRTLQKVVISR